MVGDGEPPPRVIDKLVCGNRIESGEQTEMQCPVYFVSRKRVKDGRHSHPMRRRRRRRLIVSYKFNRKFST